MGQQVLIETQGDFGLGSRVDSVVVEENELERRDEEGKKPKEKENIAKKQKVERDEEKGEHEENNLRFLTL